MHVTTTIAGENSTPIATVAPDGTVSFEGGEVLDYVCDALEDVHVTTRRANGGPIESNHVQDCPPV